MSPIWFTPFIIVAAALQAFGAVMSAQLRISLSNPWLALAVLFSLNAFFFAGLFAVLPRPLPTIEGVSAMPWWAPLAGLTGAVAVFAGLALIDSLGAGFVNGLIITANLIASLAIDQLGLMHEPVHHLNLWRSSHDGWNYPDLPVLIDGGTNVGIAVGRVPAMWSKNCFLPTAPATRQWRH